MGRVGSALVVVSLITGRWDTEDGAAGHRFSEVDGRGLLEAAEGARLVVLLERGELVGGEVDVDRGGCVVEVVGLVAPMMGALTTGLLSTHAIAICAIDTFRASAICCTPSMTGRSRSVTAKSCSRPGRRRSAWSARWRGGRRDTLRGAVGDAADAVVGEETDHLAFFLPVQQGVMVRHGVRDGSC